MKARIAWFTVAASSAVAFAEGPPPEALAACTGKSDGAACAFNLGARAVAGTCRTGPRGEASACAPEGMGPRHGPPPEALAACSGKSEGATCTTPMGSGTCRAGPHGEAVACLPAGGPQCSPPPEALSACTDKSEGAACTVAFGGHTLDGTCRAGPNGAALACAPAGMPPPP